MDDVDTTNTPFVPLLIDVTDFVTVALEAGVNVQVLVTFVEAFSAV